MTLDDNKLYIKIIALHTTYNYIVYKFFIWNYLESQNIVSQRFWNFILKLFKKHWMWTWSISKSVATILNFVVEKFLNWTYLEAQIFVLNSLILKSKIYNVQTTLNNHMVSTKVVVVDPINKLFVQKFSIWSYSESQIFVLNWHISIFNFLEIFKQFRMGTYLIPKL